MNIRIGVLNWLIEKGVIVLLVFTPLAFGTVQKWSVALMEIGSFSLLTLYMFKKTLVSEDTTRGHNNRFTYKIIEEWNLRKISALNASYQLLFLFISLIFIQLLPLPDIILRLFSPATSQLYNNFAPGNWYPVSINRYATRQDLLLLLVYVSIFIVIINHYKSREQLSTLLKTIIIVGCFLGVFSHLQAANWNGKLFWIFPVDESLIHGTGVMGPYVNRNHFAGYLEMVIPLGLGLLIYYSPDLKISSEMLKTRSYIRILGIGKVSLHYVYLGAVLILATALLASLSRGGIIASAVSFVFFIWCTRKRHALKNRSLLLSTCAIIMAVVIFIFTLDEIMPRLKGAANYSGRPTVWYESLSIVRDYPLFGSGFGTFESIYPRYQRSKSKLYYDHAHNDYVELLTDAGLIGLFLFVCAGSLFFSALYRKWRSRGSTYVQCIGAGGLSASLAMAVHSFVDFNMHIPANALLFTVVVAITYVAVYNLSDSRSGAYIPLIPDSNAVAPYFSFLSPYTLRIVVLVIGIVLLSLPVRSFIADFYYSRVGRILDNPATNYLDVKPLQVETVADYLAAIHAGELAHTLEPMQALYAATVAEHSARLGRFATVFALAGSPLPRGVPDHNKSFQKAEHYLQIATGQDPTNPDYHLALADIYEVYRKDRVKVDAELKRAVQSPFNPRIRYAVAMHYLLAGQKHEALLHAQELAKMDDSFILEESPKKPDILERMPRWYVETLYKSYLFKALEIAWRVSHDSRVVLSIVPDSLEAKNVFTAFIDSKGIDIQNEEIF